MTTMPSTNVSEEIVYVLKATVKDADGKPEEPVFLTHCMSLDMSDEMLVNLLGAYGIPALKQYPNDGDFGRLILGISGPGTDIYVPKSMYEDAVNLSMRGAEYEKEHVSGINEQSTSRICYGSAVNPFL